MLLLPGNERQVLQITGVIRGQARIRLQRIGCQESPLLSAKDDTGLETVFEQFQLGFGKSEATLPVIRGTELRPGFHCMLHTRDLNRPRTQSTIGLPARGPLSLLSAVSPFRGFLSIKKQHESRVAWLTQMG